MKKMIISVAIISLVCIVIQNCTVINLSPKLLFNRGKYNKFTELKDNLQWGNFSMYRATENSNDGIKYYPNKNFFLISSHPYFLKIDSAGNKTFQLQNTNALKFLDAVNCYVITANGIYDFSAENPVEEHFTEILNEENNFSEKVWVEDFFGKLYNAADVVLFSIYTDIVNGKAAYFRINGKWTKLYTPKSSMLIHADGNEILCTINKEKVPPKLQEEHFLKDVQNATYSNVLRYDDEYITPYNTKNTFFPDQNLEYISKAKLKTLAFAKETYTTEGYFIPGMPNRFYGTGYYRLEIENSVLNFKTVTGKDSFGGEIDNYLHVFELPNKYVNKSSVRFLTYDYNSNIHENMKKGVYVIKNTKN